MTEVSSEPRIYMRHIRKAGRCASGTSNWWKKHNLDWKDFVRNGIDGEVLVKIGDPMAMQVVKIARAERDG